MLFAFTLVNISLDELAAIHAGLDPESSSVLFANHSGSILDHLYFSVVVMTTLGFGDIHPIATASKVMVSIPCVTSYVMFALMLGIITRGIVFRDDDRK
jgi:voltage-gated potassium channel